VRGSEATASLTKRRDKLNLVNALDGRLTIAARAEATKMGSL